MNSIVRAEPAEVEKFRYLCEALREAGFEPEPIPSLTGKPTCVGIKSNLCPNDVIARLIAATVEGHFPKMAGNKDDALLLLAGIVESMEFSCLTHGSCHLWTHIRWLAEAG
jgi:hypothetical protein